MRMFERWPPPWVTSAERNDVEDAARAEWHSRFIAQLLLMQPNLDVVEALQLALAMWSIESLRERGPEAAAQAVFDSNAIRPTNR